jgi:hypothetical protein
MFLRYGKFIAKKVKAYNQVKRNLEDLAGEINLKLISSDVLLKFVLRAARTMPTTLPSREAAALLGLSFDEFKFVLYMKNLDFRKYRQDDGKLKSVPIKTPGLDFQPIDGGDMFDPSSIFKREDIETLDGEIQASSRSKPREMLWVSALGFKAYITQAIHNHFANWCRTRKRKYRDLLLPGTALMEQVDGQYHQRGHNFEGNDWESQLVTMSMNDEDMISVVSTVEREFAAAGRDIRSLTQTEAYVDEAGNKLRRPTAEAMASLELLDSMAEGRAVHPDPDRKPRSYRNPKVSEAACELTPFGDGRTIREAVKIQQRAQQRLKVRDA